MHARVRYSIAALAVAAGSLGAPMPLQAAQHSEIGAATRNLQDRPGTGPVLVLLPTDRAGSSELAGGCWVRFHDDKHFRGDSLTLAGPLDVARMPAGVWRDWDSVVVGPRANVTIYDNENFADRAATLAAGRSLPDLSAVLEWSEDVKSALVACV